MTHVIQYRVVNPNTSTDNHLSRRKSGLSSFTSSSHHSSSNVNVPSKSSDGSLPSPVFSAASTTLNTAITCLKRRRPDDSDSIHMNTTDGCAILTKKDGHHLPDMTPDHIHNPLFEHLVATLPHGFLSDVHCECDHSDPPFTQSSPPRISDCTPTLQGLDGCLGTLSSTLSLLRVLHSITRLWYSVHNVLDPLPIHPSVSFEIISKDFSLLLFFNVIVTLEIIV